MSVVVAELDQFQREVTFSTRPDPELESACRGTHGTFSQVSYGPNPVWHAAARCQGAAYARRGLVEGWTEEALAYFLELLTPEERAVALWEAARWRMVVNKLLTGYSDAYLELRHDRVTVTHEMVDIARAWQSIIMSAQRDLWDLYMRGQHDHSAAVAVCDVAAADEICADYRAQAEKVIESAVLSITKRVG